MFSHKRLISSICALFIVPTQGCVAAQPIDKEFEQVVAASAAKTYTFIGELHGTKQVPELFLKLVARLQSLGRPLVVGVELHVADSEAIDNYVTNKTVRDSEARDELLRGLSWSCNGYADGRTSQAMLNLLQQIRNLNSLKGLQHINVVPFLNGIDHDAYQLLSTAVARAGTGARLIVLTGNIHAMKKTLAIPGVQRPIASYFADNETYSLDVSAENGETWACFSDTEPCGPYKLNTSLQQNRCLETCYVNERKYGFDATFSFKTVTASAPVRVCNIAK